VIGDVVAESVMLHIALQGFDIASALISGDADAAGMVTHTSHSVRR